MKIDLTLMADLNIQNFETSEISTSEISTEFYQNLILISIVSRTNLQPH